MFEPFVTRNCTAAWRGGRIAYSGANDWAGSVALFEVELPAGRWRMSKGGASRFISTVSFGAEWTRNSTYEGFGYPFVFSQMPEAHEVASAESFRVGVVFRAGDGTCLPSMERLGDA